MALTRLGGANAITGVIPVANGGTGLASGTTDQFLKFTGTTTLASAADNAGSMVHLQTTTLSSDTAQIDFSNVFSTTYKSYLFVFNTLISTRTDDYFLARFFSDTGTTAYNSSTYEVVCPKGRSRSGFSDVGGGVSWGLSYFRPSDEVFHSNTPGSGHMYVHDPRNSSERATIQGALGLHDGNNHVISTFFGMVASNSQWYGMRFLSANGNLGSGTSISLYGLANT